jgi:hypothetical protein
MDLYQFEKKNAIVKASVWSNELKKIKSILNEDQFLLLRAKNSNTVNSTVNICVKHLFVLSFN